MITIEDGQFFSYEGIGEFHSQGSWKHPKRIISSWELIFVLDGNLAIREGNTEYMIGVNEMLLLEPGIRHEGIGEADQPVSFYWFHFRTSFPVTFKMYRGEQYYEIKSLLKRLLHIAFSPQYPPSAADAAGFLIFTEMNCHMQSSDGSDPIINRIAEYIRINAEHMLTVAEIAEYFRYSPDHISRLFKRQFGVNLQQFISARRICCAKDLLLSTDMSIKEIAGKLGWPDENHFVKFFSYHEEITPSKFRKLYSGVHMNNR